MSQDEIQMHVVLIGIRRCPHCGVAKPEMTQMWRSDCIQPTGQGAYGHNWAVYRCTSCNLLALAKSALGNQGTQTLEVLYPEVVVLSDELPDRARTYLQQAIDSIHAPDGAAMLCGSAVDAMLKEKKMSEGSVYQRIDEAVEKQILTKDMAEWAHAVRLGSNRPRHSDEADPHVTQADVLQAIEFCKTLGDVLFVLPARVKRGRAGESSVEAEGI